MNRLMNRVLGEQVEEAVWAEALEEEALRTAEALGFADDTLWAEYLQKQLDAREAAKRLRDMLPREGGKSCWAFFDYVFVRLEEALGMGAPRPWPWRIWLRCREYRAWIDGREDGA